MIRGEVYAESVAWLERSLVGELFSTEASSTLSSKLRDVWNGISDIKESLWRPETRL